jgi:hypothetical protein
MLNIVYKNSLELLHKKDSSFGVIRQAYTSLEQTTILFAL